MNTKTRALLSMRNGWVIGRNTIATLSSEPFNFKDTSFIVGKAFVVLTFVSGFPHPVKSLPSFGLHNEILGFNAELLTVNRERL